jgi:hypothetical protein
VVKLLTTLHICSLHGHDAADSIPHVNTHITPWQVAEALAKVAVISELETNVKGLGDLNAKVGRHEQVCLLTCSLR